MLVRCFCVWQSPWRWQGCERDTAALLLTAAVGSQLRVCSSQYFPTHLQEFVVVSFSFLADTVSLAGLRKRHTPFVSLEAFYTAAFGCDNHGRSLVCGLLENVLQNVFSIGCSRDTHHLCH